MCEACGHEWIPSGTPRQCSKCKSRNWNKSAEQVKDARFDGWDSVSLINLGMLPPVSGLYVVLSGNEIIYVGQSIDLRSRWKAHHIWPDLVCEELDEVRLLWVGVDALKLDEEETRLIKAYQPRLNKHRLTMISDTYTFRLPPVLRSRLQTRAEKDERTLAQVVVEACRVYLDCGVAQLAERIPYKGEDAGSIPAPATKPNMQALRDIAAGNFTPPLGNLCFVDPSVRVLIEARMKNLQDIPQQEQPHDPEMCQEYNCRKCKAIRFVGR